MAAFYRAPFTQQQVQSLHSAAGTVALRQSRPWAPNIPHFSPCIANPGPCVARNSLSHVSPRKQSSPCMPRGNHRAAEGCPCQVAPRNSRAAAERREPTHHPGPLPYFADRQPFPISPVRSIVAVSVSPLASFKELAQNGPRPALPHREFLSCMAPRIAAFALLGTPRLNVSTAARQKAQG